MTIGAVDPIAALRVSAEVLEWSERAGLRGDRERLWRKHTALQHRVGSGGRHPRTAVSRLLQLEIDVWTDVLAASLRADVLTEIASSLAPRGGLWAGLDRQMEIAEWEEWHLRSSSAALGQALRRFRDSPSLVEVGKALTALEDLIEIANPYRPRFSTAELVEGLERLIAALNKHLPAGASDYLGSLVEVRVTAEADPRWRRGMSRIARNGQARAWTPSWEQLDAPNTQGDDRVTCFLPEVGRAYEEMCHARELDLAHAQALVEDRRRATEIAERERRMMDVAALEKELEVRRHELKVWDGDARHRCEEWRAELDRVAPGLAKDELTQELRARNSTPKIPRETLKSIPRDQREWLLMDRSKLVRERLEEDMKGQERTRREALAERIGGLEARIAALRAQETTLGEAGCEARGGW